MLSAGYNAPADELHRTTPPRSVRDHRQTRCGCDRADRASCSPNFASAAAGCSSSASAAARPIARTPSTTSARSAASRPTRRPTTSASSPRAPTTKDGRRVFIEWLKVSRLQSGRHALRLLGRRRKPREERQPEPGRGAGIRQRGRRDDLRHRRPRRRLHGQGRRRLRHHPHRQSAERHAAHRGVSGRGLAPAGVASGAESRRDEVGIDASDEEPCFSIATA